MKKQVKIQDLEDNDYQANGLSNYKIVDSFCKKCGDKIEYFSVKKFLASRKKWPQYKDSWKTCKKCWGRIALYDNPKWRKLNSDAQKIAQNTSEAKAKNREGVSKSWTEQRKKKHRETMFKRWSSGVYKNHNNGGHRGHYNGIYYESWSELAFILFCIDKNIAIRRYDKNGIQYRYKSRKKVYTPDFIITENTIVEIKGKAPWYYKNIDQNIAKFDAARKLNHRFTVIFDTDECIRTYYNKARRIGNEIEKKDI